MPIIGASLQTIEPRLDYIRLDDWTTTTEQQPHTRESFYSQ